MKPIEAGFYGFTLACVLCALIALTGCAVMPDTARVGVQHLSSITQHFGANATDIGNDEVTAGVAWAPTKHTYLEVQENYIVHGSRFGGASVSDGREFFEARGGIQFDLK